jgi:hypothetical protein
MKNERIDLPLASNTVSIDEARLQFVRRLRTARGHRVNVFGAVVARELPWDILLVLYSNYERSKVNVSSISVDVGAPATTVLRWLHRLEVKGFIERSPSPIDQRVVYVALSSAGKSTLDLYFDSILAKPAY